MRELFYKISGTIEILGGVYGLFFFYYIIPRMLKNTKLKNRERLELCQRKYSKMAKIIFPIIILFGVLQLLGIIR